MYTCDIACHGVPSPKVFRKYIKDIEDKNSIKINNVYFRDKSQGWNSYSLKFKSDNKEILSLASKSKYIKLFLKDIILRPSCYDCKFSKLPRYADISLGDFWGVENKYKDFTDNKGTSLVLINNEKGLELFNNIKNNLYYKENCDLEYAIQNNPCICGSVKEHKNRKNFFKDLDKLNFEKLCNKYIPKENKIKNKTLSICSKIKHKLFK